MYTWHVIITEFVYNCQSLDNSCGDVMISVAKSHRLEMCGSPREQIRNWLHLWRCCNSHLFLMRQFRIAWENGLCSTFVHSRITIFLNSFFVVLQLIAEMHSPTTLSRLRMITQSAKLFTVHEWDAVNAPALQWSAAEIPPSSVRVEFRSCSSWNGRGERSTASIMQNTSMPAMRPVYQDFTYRSSLYGWKKIFRNLEQIVFFKTVESELLKNF